MLTVQFDRGSGIERIRAAADWLCRSEEVTGGRGSAAYYSPLFGWASPYPETTGYIIPTLWKVADVLEDSRYAHTAMRMSRWLLSIQSQEGCFPGGVWSPNCKQTGSVFNTGQILFGLLEAAERTGEKVFWDAASKAVAWLVAEQHEDGRWYNGAYVKGYSPSYYAHLCWPMALYWKRYGGDDVHRCLLRALGAVISDRTEVGTFLNWGFKPGQRAFTHTIGYTLQGLAETAHLLEQWEPYGAAACESAEILMKKFEVRKRLGGSYGLQWEPSFWFICLTGHCQLASTWLRLHEWTGDARFLNVAIKALDEVGRCQRLWPRKQNVHGAIAGSSPWFGPYMMLRYPNWAAKFFIDAMITLRDTLCDLEGESVRACQEAAE
jgi:hypothetical protein